MVQRRRKIEAAIRRPVARPGPRCRPLLAGSMPSTRRASSRAATRRGSVASAGAGARGDRQQPAEPPAPSATASPTSSGAERFRTTGAGPPRSISGRRLIPPAASAGDRFGPFAAGDGGDPFGHGHERVPGLAAGLDDGRVVGPDPQAELVLPQIFPDVLDGLVMVPLCVTFLVTGRTWLCGYQVSRRDDRSRSISASLSLVSQSRWPPTRAIRPCRRPRRSQP